MMICFCTCTCFAPVLLLYCRAVLPSCTVVLLSCSLLSLFYLLLRWLFRSGVQKLALFSLYSLVFLDLHLHLLCSWFLFLKKNRNDLQFYPCFWNFFFKMFFFSLLLNFESQKRGRFLEWVAKEGGGFLFIYKVFFF